ncbi:MAG: glutamate-1-semialdehyde 2,1-aminomutase [Bdellovibrionota bacterium]
MSDVRSMNSSQLFERSKQIVPGGVHSPVRSFKGLDHAPVFFTKAEGAYLESVEGKKYIDFCQSFGPLILGHRDPDVQEQVERMVRTAWSFGAAEIYSLELAEWIVEQIPFVEKIRFVSSGTEAVMSALRVARGNTNRSKILKFEGCYHGHVDSLLVKAGSGLAGASASSSAGVSQNVASETLVSPLDDDEALEKVFKTSGSEIAAVIIEPLPANYGLLPQRREFLERIFKLARAHGSLVIFDEVISGFRVGLQGMAGLEKFTPDLVCYGKVIGGGFPVGAYCGRKDLMDAVAPLGPVYQAGTLSANPIGMVAGLTTLKKTVKVNGWEVLEKRTAGFCAKLNKLFQDHSAPFTVDQHSSLFWIRSKTAKSGPIRRIEEISTNQSQDFKNFFLRNLDQGLYLAPNAFEVSFMSLAHTDAILADALKIMEKSLKG